MKVEVQLRRTILKLDILPENTNGATETSVMHGPTSVDEAYFM